MIIRRRCDEPMARSKRLLPCEHNCKSCVACIIRDDSGNEYHALGGQKDQCDPVLLARNMRLRGFL